MAARRQRGLEPDAVELGCGERGFEVDAEGGGGCGGRGGFAGVGTVEALVAPWKGQE